MTIATTTSRVDYTGNGVTTVFPVPYAFFGTDELQVIERVIATGAETVLTLSTNYTVSGGNGDTGTVTAVVAPSASVQWTILRNTARTQPTEYPSNDPFPSASHERALDRVTAIAQEIERDTSRAVRTPATDPAGGLVIPALAVRANRILGFDGSGNATTFSVTLGGAINPSVFGLSLIDDATAADARTTLGATATGSALFTAATAAAARTTLDVWGRAEAWVDVASAGTTDLGAATSPNVRITGTTTITSFGTVAAGTTRQLRFAGALTLTHNATSMLLPGGANIVTAADDRMVAVSLGSGNWIVTSFTPAAGLGWRQLAPTTVFGVATASQPFAIPTWASEFMVEWSDMTPSGGAGEFVARVSVDGGTLYLGGASDYEGPWADFRSGGLTAGQTNGAGWMLLSPSLTNSGANLIGDIRIRRVAGTSCLVRSGGIDSTPVRFARTASYVSAAGVAPTHISFFFTSGRNMAAGGRLTPFARA